MWIIRGKLTFLLPKEIIYSFLLPVSYKLKKSDVIKMVEAADEDDLYDAVSATVYGELFNKRDVSPELAWAKGSMQREAKLAKLNPFSIFAVIEYCHEKETEIRNIIKIAEAVEYGADRAEIKDYLVVKGGI